jgi:hypothetical protein
MSLFAHRRNAALALLLAGALGGCASRAPVVAPPVAVIDRGAEVDAIVALLDHGDSAAALPRIDALLRRDPADPQARVLRDSLDRDPVALLGPRSFAYTVRPGDTMLALSERFLGNRLKSYQLARYNGIAVPAALSAGTVLRIPGTAPEAAPPPHPAPRPRATPRPKAPVVPRTDPAGARQARAAGLAALGQGRLDVAIAALRRAAALDPASPLIRRDLARAEHVAATPGAKR